MRYTLAQLRKMQFPHKEECEYDFNEELDGFEDVKSSDRAKVIETIANIGPDSYKVDLDIEINLMLECAVTLEVLPYKIKTKASEYYTFDKETYDNGDFILVEGQTLDTREEVLSEILIEKPMKFVKNGVSFQDEIDDEPKEKINPAFPGLKDLLK